jgi:hypothetical protein
MATATTESSSGSKRRKDPPERKIGPFPNGVGVCIWSNQATSDQGPRTFRSITINPRRYFDRETNEWKDAMSYNASDLPSLIYALQLAAKYCFETDAIEQDPAAGEAGANGEETSF